MGDGVLAYFGWPQAHEDDASRAVVAAFSVVEAVAGLDSPAGETLACRIGIATGMVIVGDLIGEGVAREHAVVGPTPNLAARLQEAAGAGEIMISDTTRRLLGSGFAIESMGERMLKGHEQPVSLFRVLRCESREIRSFAAGPATPKPMVGREAELSALRRAWEQARSGPSHTVLLTGEAGCENQDFRTAARESRNGCYRKITPFWRAARRAFLLILIKIGRKRSIMGMREHPMELMWQDPTE
jgi:hypothetical protein